MTDQTEECTICVGQGGRQLCSNTRCTQRVCMECAPKIVFSPCYACRSPLLIKAAEPTQCALLMGTLAAAWLAYLGSVLACVLRLWGIEFMTQLGVSKWTTFMGTVAAFLLVFVLKIGLDRVLTIWHQPIGAFMLRHLLFWSRNCLFHMVCFGWMWRAEAFEWAPPTDIYTTILLLEFLTAHKEVGRILRQSFYSGVLIDDDRK